MQESIDYDKLTSLEYQAFDHVKDFKEKLDQNEGVYTDITVSKDYEDGVPVVNVEAQDSLNFENVSASYRLEEVNETEFEEVMYGIWESAMEEII